MRGWGREEQGGSCPRLRGSPLGGMGESGTTGGWWLHNTVNALDAECAPGAVDAVPCVLYHNTDKPAGGPSVHRAPRVTRPAAGRVTAPPSRGADSPSSRPLLAQSPAPRRVPPAGTAGAARCRGPAGVVAVSGGLYTSPRPVSSRCGRGVRGAPQKALDPVWTCCSPGTLAPGRHREALT